MKISLTSRRWAPIAVASATALVLVACGSGNDPENTTAEGGESTEAALSGEVVIDGSSTVFPLTSAAAELFQEENPGVQVSVGNSGTGGGFEKFCAGETDISDASRPIEDDEIAICEENGVTQDEFAIANDALTVVVNPENDWATCLTVEQLNAIWEPGSTVNSWNQVDPSFPDEPLVLAGAGTDSGTFDYFTDAINGEEGASRTDYQASEDDNVTIQAVEGSKGSMGYFGYSYFAREPGDPEGAGDRQRQRLCRAEPGDCSGWLVHSTRPAAVHLPVRRGDGTARSRGVRSASTSRTSTRSSRPRASSGSTTSRRPRFRNSSTPSSAVE